MLDAIRKDTYGIDIGQNSWLTVDEYERLLPLLRLGAGTHVLEVASGSGGPAIYVARTQGCRVTGIDANESGIATATQLAAAAGLDARVQFRRADATGPLPFAADAFDALVCIDSMNHFPDRAAVLREWQRVLRPGGRALFTDPVVITGLVTNDELARRSSIGLFVFVPPGVNETLIQEAGLRVIRQEDVTANAALTRGTLASGARRPPRRPPADRRGGPVHGPPGLLPDRPRPHPRAAALAAGLRRREAGLSRSSRRRRAPASAQRPERVREHVVGHAPALRDALGLVERPVDAEVDAALAVLLLGLRERREAARHAAAARRRRCRRVTPLNSSETNVNAMSSRAVERRRIWNSAPPKPAWPDG